MRLSAAWTAAVVLAGAAAITPVSAGPATAAAGSVAAPAFPRFLVGWGDDLAGQLGDGMTGGLAPTPVRVKLAPGTKAASFRAGCDSSVVLTAGGRVLDFGSNSFGQLGDGKKAGSAIPVQARFPAGTKITAIRAGCDYNLALTAAGRVFAWGQNPADRRIESTRPRAAAAGTALPARVRFPAVWRDSALHRGRAGVLLRPGPSGADQLTARAPADVRRGPGAGLDANDFDELGDRT
jgi:hypothetical protein